MMVLSLEKHLLTKFHITFRILFFRPSIFRKSISQFVLLTVLAVLKMISLLAFSSLTFFRLNSSELHPLDSVRLENSIPSGFSLNVRTSFSCIYIGSGSIFSSRRLVSYCSSVWPVIHLTALL